MILLDNLYLLLVFIFCVHAEVCVFDSNLWYCVVTYQDGIKLLNTWLEGERSYSFCKYIGLNTAKLRPDEVPHCKIIFKIKFTCIGGCNTIHLLSQRKLFTHA